MSICFSDCKCDRQPCCHTDKEGRERKLLHDNSGHSSASTKVRGHSDASKCIFDFLMYI